MHQQTTDSLFAKTAVKFDENAEDREALHTNINENDTRTTNELERLEDLMNKNHSSTNSYVTDIEKHLTEQSNIQKKTIQNMKFELVEILDTKQDSMQRQFDVELSRVKSKYENAVTKVDEASKNLQ